MIFIYILMITSFKIFENKEKEITFIPNHLFPYFEHKSEEFMLPFIDDVIFEFFKKIIGFTIKFECRICYDDSYIVVPRQTLDLDKYHEGILKRFEFGHYRSKLDIKIELKNVKYTHKMDADKPITIYGNLPDDIIETINDCNLYMNIKKYNL